jgi:hypothetical protein
LVAFGTSFIPPNEELEAIFQYVASNNKYGFVIAFKKEYFKQETLDIVKNLKHVYLT